MRKRNFRFALIALAVSVMLAGPLAEFAAAQSAQPVGAPAATQVPQPQDNSVNWPGAGYGAGALLCNVLYIPAKLVYALLGGIVGGGTYLITAGNQQAANTVWRSALGGDYVVTPQMLAGQQPINFSGPTDTPPTAPEPVTSSSSSMTTTTASSGGVAPIPPLPASGPAANTSSTGGQPLDHGAGPASGSASGANIE
ncbi:MAG TPA: hypothetical protein VIW95_00945 [Candidatus Binatus sp.]|uniref:hypothetical protein n=1 Tax=Candidatus Binatus sp. TaxID=2811406 RepID=UPI002F42F3E6